MVKKQDPRELAALRADDIRTRLFGKTEDLPPGVVRLAIKTIHLNKSPMVTANLKTLTPEMAARWGLDLGAQLRHAERAAGLPDMSGIWPAVFQRPEEAAPDVDEDLYGGFVGNADRRRLTTLRGLSADKLATTRNAFDDPRLEELVFRYRARNFPATLPADDRQRWEEHRAGILFDGAGGARTMGALFDQIDKLSETVDERGEEILGALYDYAESIAPDR